MPDEWDISDAELDSWVEEWQAVDQAAAGYLAERVPGMAADMDAEDRRWISEVAATISPPQEPTGSDAEAVAAVIALQHADWLGIVLGACRRGPGSSLDPEIVQADVEGLDDVDGGIEDPSGHVAVLDLALLHLRPLWQDLGVLDRDDRLTERGAWALARALHQVWSD